jgi:CheY-like chemotaxis protein
MQINEADDKPTILVTDDDAMTRMLTRQCLEAENMMVLEAENGPATIYISNRSRGPKDSALIAHLKHPGPMHLVETVLNSDDEVLRIETAPRQSKAHYPKILIVDDVETNRFLLRIQLEAVADIIIEADNGETALTSYQEHRPKLILMDC